MIEATHLRKVFGTFEAVRDISLSIAAGEVVALLGPNGAGKTTTVRMLAAILKPTSGRAMIAGYDVATHAREVRRHVGLLTEFPGLYVRMRPLEYLQFFGTLQGMSSAHSAGRGTQLLQRFGLWDARDKRLDSFSKGMKQKVALIRALMHDPPVLYLDEPTTAMDPQSARTVRDAIAELRAARRTILLTTHNLTEAEELADRIVLIRGGAIVAQGTIQHLTEQLLGEPTWELRLANHMDTLPLLLDDLVTIEAVGTDWARFRCADPHAVNPQILARLVARGVPVVSLAELPRSLEQVYLRIVGEDDLERGSWSSTHEYVEEIPQ
ncbi:MAG TPA: ABC transporter ATP-binding protein [Roseiflexaceae bacterium]|jgi:ABC-2 type transport system ATP-binding protein|nr:ABC transporter ATP-binding protein [Roseiflexaceae bacterium]